MQMPCRCCLPVWPRVVAVRLEPLPPGLRGHAPNVRRLSHASEASRRLGMKPERRAQLLELNRQSDGALSLLTSTQLYRLAQSRHPPLYALGRIHEALEARRPRGGRQPADPVGPRQSDTSC